MSRAARADRRDRLDGGGTVAGVGDQCATVAYPLVVANIAGDPGMLVPLGGTPVGLPLGVHFLGRFGDEATLLRLAAQIEQAQPWAHVLPPVNATADGRWSGDYGWP
jgi:hypothetical protein